MLAALALVLVLVLVLYGAYLVLTFLARDFRGAAENAADIPALVFAALGAVVARYQPREPDRVAAGRLRRLVSADQCHRALCEGAAAAPAYVASGYVVSDELGGTPGVVLRRVPRCERSRWSAAVPSARGPAHRLVADGESRRSGVHPRCVGGSLLRRVHHEPVRPRQPR